MTKYKLTKRIFNSFNLLVSSIAKKLCYKPKKKKEKQNKTKQNKKNPSPLLKKMINYDFTITGFCKMNGLSCTTKNRRSKLHVLQDEVLFWLSYRV